MKNQTRLAAVLSLAFVALLGCNKKPSAIANGNEVKVHYTLTIDDKVVDSSQGKAPLAYVAGTGQILPALDEQLIGLKVGDKKHVVLPPEKGYGLVRPDAVQKVPLTAFGDTKSLKPGMIVTGNNGGRPVQARVISIDKKNITLDLNHPLAGKTLNFDIEIVEIGIPVAPAQMPPAAKPQ